MIPENFIEQWRVKAPWQTLAMIEQDLVISRALVELYNQPNVKSSLIFRGGTALNKLYIQPPARYSEDIDLVQIKPEPIGQVLDAIREVLDNWLGEPRRKSTERSAKLVYRYLSINNTPAKLKIEINTTEHFTIQPILSTNYEVNSNWFQGKTNLLTYSLDEMIATKLRALYQRRKGRDLFDIWYVLKQQLVNLDQVVSIFKLYCKHNKQVITRSMFEKNLSLKQQHHDFLSDISALLSIGSNWHLDEAINLVKNSVLTLLDSED